MLRLALSLLQQHSPHSTSIHCQYKRSREVRGPKNRTVTQKGLDPVKRLLADGGPLLLRVLPQQVSQRREDSRIASNKAPVITNHSQKSLKGTSAVWGLKVLNSLHLGLWWGHLTVTHHIPKVLHTGLDKLTLVQINNKAGLFQLPDKCFHIIKMFFPTGVEHYNIVYVHGTVLYTLNLWKLAGAYTYVRLKVSLFLLALFQKPSLILYSNMGVRNDPRHLHWLGGHMSH